MIKVKAIQEFTLKDFDKIKNIVRASNKNEKGRLYKDDTFECSKEMGEYLTGKNALNKTVVEIIEVIEEIKENKEGFIPIEKIEEAIGGELAIEETNSKIVVKPKTTKKKKTSKK